MKKAFTLIELLVVIAIIGILAGVLMGTFSGSTESAHTARCLSNMRNLASACQSASVAIGHYPPAGSFEIVSTKLKGAKVHKQYFGCDGWISWNSRQAYAKDSNDLYPSSHKASGSWNTSMYEQDEDTRKFCLTNGVIWKYVNGNHTIYLCPQHERVKKALNPNWSYVMNAKFGWDYSKGQRPIAVDNSSGIAIGSTGLSNADKVLLFAEIPFKEHDDVTVSEDTSGEKTDSILQYDTCKGCGSAESIGFNHRNGKQYFANVVFADGHTEKFIYPKTGISSSEMNDLTKWLCTGVDVSFDGKKYKELDD